MILELRKNEIFAWKIPKNYDFSKRTVEYKPCHLINTSHWIRALRSVAVGITKWNEWTPTHISFVSRPQYTSMLEFNAKMSWIVDWILFSLTQNSNYWDKSNIQFVLICEKVCFTHINLLVFSVVIWIVKCGLLFLLLLIQFLMWSHFSSNLFLFCFRWPKPL